MLAGVCPHGADSRGHPLRLSKARHHDAGGDQKTLRRRKSDCQKPSAGQRGDSGGGTDHPFGEPPVENNAPGAISAAASRIRRSIRALSRRFSNRGATVKSWTLKKFTGQRRQAARTGEPERRRKGRLPVLTSHSATSSRVPTSTKRCGSPIPGTDYHFLRILRRPHPRHQNLCVGANGYMVQYSDEVTLNGAGLPASGRMARRLRRHGRANAAGQQATIHYDSRRTNSFAKPRKRQKRSLQRRWNVLLRRYRRSVFRRRVSAPANTTLETTTFQDIVASPVNSAEESLSRRCGGRRRPQSVRNLHRPERDLRAPQVNPKLDGIVDWGWFGIVAKPLFIGAALS